MYKLAKIHKEFDACSFEDISMRDVLSAVWQVSDSLEVRRHPLGFYHAELTQFVNSIPGERFRLHFWLDKSGVSDGLGDLHEHTWHLSSLVLVGCVLDSNLVAVPSATGEFNGSRIVYGEVNRSVSIGRFDLDPVQERRIEAGSLYEIPSRTVHLNAVDSIPTVTLVRSFQDNRPEGPLVFNRVGTDDAEATAERLQIDASVALEKLEAALPARSV